MNKVINEATLFNSEHFSLVQETENDFTVKQIAKDDNNCVIFEKTYKTEEDAQFAFFNRVTSYAACFITDKELTPAEFFEKTEQADANDY